MRNPDREDHWIPAFAGMTTRKFNLDRVLCCTEYPILHRVRNLVKAAWWCFGNFLSVTGVVIGRKMRRRTLQWSFNLMGRDNLAFLIDSEWRRLL